MFETMEGMAQAVADGGVDILDGLIAIEGQSVGGKLLHELVLESDGSEVLLDNLSLTDTVLLVFQGKATAQYSVKLNGQVGASDYEFVGAYAYGSSGAGSSGDSTNGDFPFSVNTSGTEETLCLAILDIAGGKAKYLSYSNALGDSDTKEMQMIYNGRSNFTATAITRISLLDTNGGDGFKAGSIFRFYQLG